MRSRLRSPAGDPLATLENLLARLRRSIDSDNSAAQLGHLLLLEAIERLVEASTASFFVANRHVCRSFFSRIRPHLIEAAEALPSPEPLFEQTLQRHREHQYTTPTEVLLCLYVFVLNDVVPSCVAVIY